MGKASKRFALGALIAGAAGYVAGILTAPKAGKETRKDIKQAANKALTEGEKALKKAHVELSSAIKKADGVLKGLKGRAKAELTDKLRLAKKAQAKAKELLSALHEGAADNKELQSALKEAKAAAGHLKKFFRS